MSLRKLYYSLPPAARILARRVFYLPHDILSKLAKSDELMPPKGMIYTGGGDFIETGKRFLSYFKSHGYLGPNDKVLDIGSGIGRLAIPLSTYLEKDAIYNGFDVMQQGVDWCKENISSRFGNFNFHHVALKNDLYRNDGASASEYSFPIENESQDFVFLISVFTHLVPKETEHYLAEISRMLKPGKTCFGTFFILDPALDELNPNFSFKYRKHNFALMDEKVESANVAFDKNHLFDTCRKLGLEVEHYFPGHWRKNPNEKSLVTSQSDHLDFQDILVLKKSAIRRKA